MSAPANRVDCAATALAPASAGADAHADHESIASVGHERGHALEEKTVERTGTITVGIESRLAAWPET